MTKDLRLLRMLVLITALFALGWQPAAIASPAAPQTTVTAASADPCSACPDIQHGCVRGCMSCDGAMQQCRAGFGCASAVAAEPIARAGWLDARGSRDAPAVLAELHGRSIKPEIHPPSPSDQQA